MKKRLLILALLVTGAAHAATFNVNSTADVVDANPGDGVCATAAAVCTLRAAVQEANALAGADTINLPAGTYNLTLSGGIALTIGGDLSIAGAGPATTTVSGPNFDSIFKLNVAGGGPVSISNLTITGGKATASTANDGSGIFIGNAYTATLTRVNISGNNSTSGGGGGLMVNTGGSLILLESTVANNSAQSDGGGLKAEFSSSVQIGRSTFSSNSAANEGGGIYYRGALTVSNSTVSGNSAVLLGSGISKGVGSGSLTLESSTLTANSGPSQLYMFGSTTVRNTILALPATGTNCSGSSPTSGGTNIDSGSSCGFSASGDLNNTDPLLSPLANNGGPTQTQALQAGSPAINAGQNANALATDQRGTGFPRVVGSQADIGAFEAAAPVVPVASIGPVSLIEGNAGTTVMNFPVTLSSPAPAGGVTIGYITSSGTATGNVDYASAGGANVVVIPAGATTGSVPITINGDTTVEPDETFTVTIFSGNATLGTASAIGSILNDDTAAPPGGPGGTGVTSVPVDNPFALAAGGLLILGFAWRRRLLSGKL